jgi:hypothetical protein
VEILPMAGKVQNGISHELSRSVPGNVPAALHLKHFDAAPNEL